MTKLKVRALARLVACGFAALAALGAAADTLETTDGRRIEGRLVSQDATTTVFDAYRSGAFIRMTVESKRVASLTKRELPPQASPPKPTTGAELLVERRAGTAPAPSSAAVLPSAGGKVSATQPAAPAAASDVLDAVERAVFQVRAKGAGNSVFATGTGCLVGDDGLAVTNFHVIQGAATAVGAFGARAAEEIPLELCAVSPDMDLAIVRLQVDPRRHKPLPAGLRLQPEPPRAGAEVWAVGFPLGMDYTVNHGHVNAVRSFGELAPSIQKVLRYDRRSRWLQTDCSINHGNSGGPLVDTGGRLLGLNTWYWPDGNNMYFALGAEHVSELLKQQAGAPPIGFAEAGRRFAGQSATAAATGAFPAIHIPRVRPASDAVQKASAMVSSTSCRVCNNTGFVAHRVKTGGGIDGLGMHRSAFGAEKDVCPNCRGQWFNERAIATLGPGLVEAIAGARPNDPDLDGRFRQAADYVRQAMAVDPPRFQRALGGSFLKATWKESTKLGTPFLGTGTLVGDLRMPAEGDRIQFVRIGSRTVLLSNLVMSEAATKGTVVFGGCFAGYLDGRSGEVIPVLQNAFLIEP